MEKLKKKRKGKDRMKNKNCNLGKNIIHLIQIEYLLQERRILINR